MGEDEPDFFDFEDTEEEVPSRRRGTVRVVAWGTILVLVLGGAASYGGFVSGSHPDLSVGSHHRVTLHPQAGCANAAPALIGHTVWDVDSTSPSAWGDQDVSGVLTVTAVDANEAEVGGARGLRHAVFVADRGGQVDLSGGVGGFSSLPCLIAG